jgi:hypothetical protein
MWQPESKRGLIHNKRGAVIALCLTGYVAALSFRNVLSHSPRKHPWILDLGWLAYLHFALPAWAVVGVNLVFYAGLFWFAVVFYRIAQGKERVLVVGWFADIFLGLIQILVSAPAATAIDYAKVIVTVVAFLATADIFLRIPASVSP